MRWINLSEQNQTLDQFISRLRNEIVLSHSQTEQFSLGAFDKIVQQIQQLGQLLKTKEDEIKRLQDICNKNKIDFKPNSEKPSK